MISPDNVALFVPCLVDHFYPEIADHVWALLTAIGYKVSVPKEQTCCGQPAYNAGYRHEATRIARHFMKVFEECACIVAPSGSCVSMVKNQYQYLDFTSDEISRWQSLRSRLFEFSQFLGQTSAAQQIEGSFPHRVYYHASCHGLRELGLRTGPAALLSKLEGIELVDQTPSREQCCGFGGIFSMHYSELAASLGSDTLQYCVERDAEYVVTLDAGCMLHLSGTFKRQGSTIEPIHLATLLYRAMGLTPTR
ncbi:(Fe-S)-binding protein [bacterium]|nr:(Fe-S)-binding protein [bacterium]